MKKILPVIFLLQLSTLYVHAQQNKNAPSGENIFYYYKGQKVFFGLTYKQIVVGVKEGHSINELQTSMSAQSKVPADSISPSAVKNQYIVKLNANAGKGFGKAVATSLKSNSIVLYSHPCIIGIGGKLSSYGNDFVVKLKSGITQQQFTVFLKAHNCTITRPYMFDKNIFIVGAGAANDYDALKIANLFYESGLFVYAEPDFEIYNTIEDPNDSLYYLQWDHKNTGSAAQYNGVPGADMNVDSAWTITQGKSTIKVAVIDVGVDTGHADLKANLVQGFDCLSLTSNPGDGRPLSGANAHGTCCAGIIAAIANNKIGIAGIAPKCKIIPINLADANGNFTTYSNIAAGFDYAWMNGADVLTNSWGGGTPSDIMDDAIYRALTEGRSGKGCVIFFSAGNNDAGLSYPAFNTNVIAVGGINMCNQRKSPSSCDGENWGASYGQGLAVVAPCVKIPTTDITGTNGYSSGDYFTTFNGTSAASPHAAAVAALVLSVNANLTEDNVKTIIENSADKIPGYTFQYTPGYDNGTWNYEMGYGRVDAYHAVEIAKNGKFCNAGIVALGPTRFCKGDNVKLQIVNKDNSASYKWYEGTKVISSGPANVTVKESGVYNIIADYTNGCEAVSPSITVTSVANNVQLTADAGQNISLCSGSAGARIGGMTPASGGAPFLNDKRIYSMDWYTNNFYRYSITNPLVLDTVATNVVSTDDFNDSYFFSGGDFTPFGYYALTRITNKLIRIDTINGSQQLINIITPKTGNWQGLAWDPKGQQLYAMSSFGTYSELYTVDLISGNLYFLATIKAYDLVWIAFNNEGKLYGLSTYTKTIYSIDKQSGAASSLPNEVEMGINYAQDADFDPISDSLYLTDFIANQKDVGDLQIANTTTGTAALIGDINISEMDATGIAGYTYRYKWSPSTGLSDSLDANPFANPSKTTTYTLTVSDLCGNQATSSIKVTVNASKPTVKITAAKSSLCNGKSVHLSATANNNYIYQWYRNDTLIAKATDSFYVTKQAGSYTVDVTYGLGGCDSLSKPFVLNACSALEYDLLTDNADEKTIDPQLYKLYPNPATTVVTITLPPSKETSELSVYDMQGRVLLTKSFNGNSTAEQLNVSHLAAGMYRIVWRQSKQEHTWKFLKQ